MEGSITEASTRLADFNGSFLPGRKSDRLWVLFVFESHVDYLGSLEVNLTVVFYSTGVAIATAM